MQGSYVKITNKCTFKYLNLLFQGFENKFYLSAIAPLTIVVAVVANDN